MTVDMRIKDDKTDKIVVRWVPTPDDIVDKMAEMAKVGKNDIVYDPGCGNAVMLIRPITKFGAKKGIGIDIDPKMVAVAKQKAKEAGVANKVVIRLGDILNEKDMDNVRNVGCVLIYIGDDLGARISPLLQKVLKPGTRIVSHRFSLGDWKPEKTEIVKGLRWGRIHHAPLLGREGKEGQVTQSGRPEFAHRNVEVRCIFRYRSIRRPGILEITRCPPHNHSGVDVPPITGGPVCTAHLRHHAMRAEDPKLQHKDYDKLIVDTLKEVHNTGAELYNNYRDFNGTIACTRAPAHRSPTAGATSRRTRSSSTRASQTARTRNWPSDKRPSSFTKRSRQSGRC